MTKSISERLKVLKLLKEKVKNHPLAYDVIERGNNLVIITPYNLYGLNGIVISDNISTTEKYKLAIEKLEKLWQEDSLFSN